MSVVVTERCFRSEVLWDFLPERTVLCRSFLPERTVFCRSFLPERTVFCRSFLPERTFAARRTAVGRTSAPRRRVALTFHLVWSLVAASREVLLGKEDLPKSATPHTIDSLPLPRLDTTHIGV